MQIEKMLELLPSMEGYQQNIPVADAEKMGIHFCGDSKDGIPLHKFLAREGVMLTYYRMGSILYYIQTQPLSE